MVGGMGCVWAIVVGGVGTDGGLVDEGCADVGGGEGGMVCVCGGTVWAYILACVWATVLAFCEGGGGGAED